MLGAIVAASGLCLGAYAAITYNTPVAIFAFSMVYAGMEYIKAYLEHHP